MRHTRADVHGVLEATPVDGEKSQRAREQLGKLTHVGSLKEHVRAFANLLLEIDGMGEKDKLFFFLDSLQPWAKMELRKQKVRDLHLAYAVADLLVDPNGERPPEVKTRPTFSFQCGLSSKGHSG